MVAIMGQVYVGSKDTPQDIIRVVPRANLILNLVIQLLSFAVGNPITNDEDKPADKHPNQQGQQAKNNHDSKAGCHEYDAFNLTLRLLARGDSEV